MELKKYEIMIYKRIQKTLLQWTKTESISQEELVKFLNSVKVTSEKKGLSELMQIVNQKLEDIEKQSKENWTSKEWQIFVSPLIAITDRFVPFETIKKVISNENKNLDQDFILLVDDDLNFVTLTKHLLEKQGFSVVVAPNGKRGIEMIYDFRPSLILIDIELPDMSGFAILEQIVHKSRKNYTPVTMIGTDDSKENRIHAYEKGAIDFIAKPIEPDLFVACVKNRIEHKKAIEQSIIIDDLTGVYNRSYMNERMEQLIHQFLRTKCIFTVIIMDLDYFKKVNDSYGHVVGDEVLRRFAAVSKEMKRENDIMCRYGGEEFVLLLPNTSKIGAKRVIKRFQDAFSEQVFQTQGTEFKVTFSAGISEINDTNAHGEQLIDEADQALYCAKQSGRNCSIVFDKNIQGVKKREKVTVIIVDDDTLIRKMLMTHFSTWEPSERYDINVIEFKDGVFFLESDWYHEGEKYMILLDGIMPKMDGMEVLTKVREDYPNNNILISMLTGLTKEEYIIRALALGADDYIVKPFDIDDVSARVLRLINRVFV
jgi:two-component system cell cycle response regulator